MNNKDKFKEIYTQSLHDCVEQYPDEYRWQEGLTVEQVAEKMFAAIDRGTFHHVSRGFKLTCRRLGIKHTRSAIFEYWRG